MKTFIKFLLGFIFIFSTSAKSIYSQSQISGTINTEEGQALPYVNLLLISAKDSSLIKGEVSDENGTYQIKNLKQGEYLLKASMIGFIDYYSQPITLEGQVEDKKLKTITLVEDAVQLESIEVVA